MPAPSGQIPPPWAWWENEAPATRAARRPAPGNFRTIPVVLAANEQQQPNPVSRHRDNLRYMWTLTLRDLASILAVVGPLVVAIVVPWLAFRYALLREQRQWSREQRAQVYVDLLIEASAEHDWLLNKLDFADTPAHDVPAFQDHRMSDKERRRLGARVLAYGSKEVVRRHNALSGEGTWALMQMRDEFERNAARINNELAFDALQAQIRLELESEQGLPRWRRQKPAQDPLKGKPPPAFRTKPPPWLLRDDEPDEKSPA
jgi:hypothetical protein